MNERLIKAEMEIGCSKERCVCGKRQCKFLQKCDVFKKMYCLLFEEYIWNDPSDIVPSFNLRRCKKCLDAEKGQVFVGTVH